MDDNKADVKPFVPNFEEVLDVHDLIPSHSSRFEEGESKSVLHAEDVGINLHDVLSNSFTELPSEVKESDSTLHRDTVCSSRPAVAYPAAGPSQAPTFYCALCQLDVPTTVYNLLISRDPTHKGNIRQLLLMKYSTSRVDEALSADPAFVCRWHIDEEIYPTVKQAASIANSVVVSSSHGDAFTKGSASPSYVTISDDESPPPCQEVQISPHRAEIHPVVSSDEYASALCRRVFSSVEQQREAKRQRNRTRSRRDGKIREKGQVRTKRTSNSASGHDDRLEHRRRYLREYMKVYRMKNAVQTHQNAGLSERVDDRDSQQCLVVENVVPSERVDDRDSLQCLVVENVVPEREADAKLDDTPTMVSQVEESTSTDEKQDCLPFYSTCHVAGSTEEPSLPFYSTCHVAGSTEEPQACVVNKAFSDDRSNSHSFPECSVSDHITRYLDTKQAPSTFYCRLCQMDVPTSVYQLVITPNPAYKETIRQLLLMKYCVSKVDETLEGDSEGLICRTHVEDEVLPKQKRRHRETKDVVTRTGFAVLRDLLSTPANTQTSDCEKRLVEDSPTSSNNQEMKPVFDDLVPSGELSVHVKRNELGATVENEWNTPGHSVVFSEPQKSQVPPSLGTNEPIPPKQERINSSDKDIQEKLRRARRNEQARLRRAAESAEKQEERRRKSRENRRKNRQAQQEEAKQADETTLNLYEERKRKERERMRLRRQREDPQVRAERLARTAELQRQRRMKKDETVRLRTNEYARKWKARLTEEQLQEYNEQKKENYRLRRLNETEQEKEARRKRMREYMRNYLKNEKNRELQKQRTKAYMSKEENRKRHYERTKLYLARRKLRDSGESSKRGKSENTPSEDSSEEGTERDEWRDGIPSTETSEEESDIDEDRETSTEIVTK